MEELRIALLQNNTVFNIVVGASAEEVAEIFDCQAIEITEQTGEAFIGLGYQGGKFEQPPPSFDPIPEPPENPIPLLGEEA